MFVDLVESLCCPRGHEPSQLVVSATRTESRYIVEGVLGCPVCHSEFPIRGGVLVIDNPPGRPPADAPSVEQAMRLAAFLELSDARGFALLCGRWAAHVGPLAGLSETPVVLVNPPEGATAGGSAIILTPDRVPFARGAARAAAIEASMPPLLVRSVVDSVRAGGRLVGDAAMLVPDGVAEIARDDRAWVGERAAAPDEAPRLVTLRRAGG